MSREAKGVEEGRGRGEVKGRGQVIISPTWPAGFALEVFHGDSLFFGTGSVAPLHTPPPYATILCNRMSMFAVKYCE
jgi:hypothetical protein